MCSSQDCWMLRLTDPGYDLQPVVSPDPTSVNVKVSQNGRYLVGDGSAQCLGVDLSSKVCTFICILLNLLGF